MAMMGSNNRYAIKWVRDKAKSSYEKGTECYICGSQERLDFHHFHTLTVLLDKWLKEKIKIRPEHYTEEYVVVWRDEFIEDHHKELYVDAATLCHKHHLQLHSIYGKNPTLHTVEKQRNWLQIQREKNGLA
jgi:hypothetical protein